MTTEHKFITHTESQTFEVGKALSEQLGEGDILAIDGELGAGKSVLVRGIAAGLGFLETMPSPTFNIVNRYSIDQRMFNHFDVYRIHSQEELFETGFFEYINEGITAIEWAENVYSCLEGMSGVIRIRIRYTDDGREITVGRQQC